MTGCRGESLTHDAEMLLVIVCSRLEWRMVMWVEYMSGEKERINDDPNLAMRQSKCERKGVHGCAVSIAGDDRLGGRAVEYVLWGK